MMSKSFFLFFIIPFFSIYSQSELEKLLTESKEICKKDVPSGFCKALKFYENNLIDSCYIASGKALLNEKDQRKRDILNYFQGYSAIDKGFLKKALKNFEAVSDSSYFKTLIKYKIGYLHIEAKKYRRAISLYESILEETKSFDNSQLKSLHYNLGVAYLHENNFKKAKKHLNYGLGFIEKNDTIGTINYKINLANIYYAEYLDDKAVLLFYETYNSAKQTTNLELKKLTTYNVAIVERNRKDYKKSLSFYQEFLKLKDSITNRDRVWELAELEKKNAVKFKEKELLVEKEKFKRQKAITLFLLVIFILILIMSYLIFNYRKKQLLLKSELQKLKGIENERKRISEELHDGVLGSLFGIRFNLGLINLDKEKKDTQKFETLLNELHLVEREVRDVSHKLGTIIPDIQDFPASLKKLVHKKSLQGNFEYDIQLKPEIDWSIINIEIKINLYRILQELLHNVVKHSKAKKIHFSLSIYNNTLIFYLKDDGIGYDFTNNLEGIGLKNIKDRAYKINAKHDFSSEVHEGFSLNMSIPF